MVCGGGNSLCILKEERGVKRIEVVYIDEMTFNDYLKMILHIYISTYHRH